MNFTEAVEYAKNHCKDDIKSVILGVAPLSDNEEFEFHLIELAFHPAAIRTNNPANCDASGNIVDGYCAYSLLGNLFDSDELVNNYSCNSIEELAAILPDYAARLHYKAYDAEFLESDDEAIDSELPLSLSDDEFKATAIKLLNERNKVL